MSGWGLVQFGMPTGPFLQSVLAFYKKHFFTIDFELRNGTREGKVVKKYTKTSSYFLVKFKTLFSHVQRIHLPFDREKSTISDLIYRKIRFTGKLGMHTISAIERKNQYRKIWP
jgi:hypothetical protein